MATEVRCIECDVLIKHLDNTFDNIEYSQCEKHITAFGVLDYLNLKPGDTLILPLDTRYKYKLTNQEETKNDVTTKPSNNV